tara:strand:- start:612 stop:1115 length:504 start_codon:yes stop_codon:yes gene_type:complete
MNDESEFEKLLKESLIDTDNILKEKSGAMVKNEKHKSYTEVLVSHEDLYDDIIDIDFIHKKDGIQNKIINNLKTKRFDFKSDEILDLHGLDVNEAEYEINRFLKYHYNKSSKYLLIIHGKGTKNQSNKAPIKKLVEKMIISSPHVLAANSAIRSNGGRGATVLLIKN